MDLNDLEHYDEDEVTYTLTAHRGGAGLFLENSWRAFKEVVPLVEIIECDVHETLDGDVIVFHDAVLDDFFKDRDERAKGDVSRWSVQDLEKLVLDPQDPDNHLVRLAWLLDHCKRRNVLLQVELKAQQDGAIYQNMLATIQGMTKKCRTPDSVHYITFYGEYCDQLKAMDLIKPHTQFLLCQSLQEHYGYQDQASLMRLLKKWGMTRVGMSIEDDKMIALTSGLEVERSFWGVNQTHLYHKALGLGACNMTTDYPNLNCFSL